MTRRIVVFCQDRLGDPIGSGRHRWAVVPGVHSDPEHPYTERRCRRCRIYETEVR